MKVAAFKDVDSDKLTLVLDNMGIELTRDEAYKIFASLDMLYGFETPAIEAEPHIKRIVVGG